MKQINTIIIAVGGKGRRISADLKKAGFNSSKVLLLVDGKPILERLIDNALKENFKRIFLLVSYYETELRNFLNQKYSGNKKIIPVYGGRKGMDLGVPFLIHGLKKRLRDPFIYSDGNILYKQSLLHRMKSIKKRKKYLVYLALSSRDHAPTHSQVIKVRNKLFAVNTRLSSEMSGLRKSKRMRSYYSLGLMALSPAVFSLVPKFAYLNDLDYVVKDIFDCNKDLVKGIVYAGQWLSLHTVSDLDRFEIR